MAAVEDPRALLRALLDAAIAAAQPERCLPPHLPPPPPRGRTVLVGAGKAAAAMARAVEQRWPGPLQGLVVTRYGHGVPCQRVEVVEAAHPLPDAEGQRAAGRILALVQGLTEDDLVLCLWSGGGSALLAWPPSWLSLAEARAIGDRLLRSGAPIRDVNCVRKHLSGLHGGQLGAACWPARVKALMISDVPGDDPTVIASGPTLGDPSTAAQALAVLSRHGIELPAALRSRLAAHETPKPGDPRLARCSHTIVATARDALDAAAAAARAHGVHPLRLGDCLEGEARELGAAHGARARRIASGAESHPRPCVLLSGGETTVTVRGRGRGGRNSEYALGLALALQGQPGVWALAADTDGLDGTEDNAGCLVTPDTLARAAGRGIEPLACLTDNDSYSLFAALGDLIVTGPTRTNVNDLRALLFE